ncbi:NAD-dependent epimerase/dehydratase family protein [archaeon]|jgi:UDP-glucose 4-epimerase|nr:NAD-dependent epimerase/dehydratase family protein [archaeon]MBT4022062.1 NAD-dependent epimerase/dehydratase family protein [archaeon]MBT4272675.1 NAD-dependent epimerase/dehydratase family protein [archaeon]MBT4461473.1 NAD-dependent epimerase/dehydratase family protein [archaeon]MBT4857757.1 NAD-dependent epimerase/dehydratase family protein [archaeon]
MKTKVLVTGGAGFIGKYLVEEIKDKYDVTIADNLSKKESSVPKGVKFIQVDLTNPIKTNEVFKDVDICLNLASKIGGIGYFHKHPGWILSENNKIFSSTFEAAVKNNVKRMVYLSSSMAYESSKIFPHKELDIDNIPPPITGYGFSKLVGEYYCKTFQREFDLDFTIIRPFNVYGINEFPGAYIGYSHVIPDLVKKILQGQYPLELLGDGNQTRCFTHVKDLVRGIVMAMESPRAINQDFNLGTSNETRMIDLAKIIWELCETKKEFKVTHLPAFKHDVRKRIPDVSKAKEILGWEPKISFEKGLKEVVDWLRTELR